MTLKLVKPWLIMALIFVTGAVTGHFLTLGLGARFPHEPMPKEMQRHLMERLTNKLHLTPDQQSRIAPMVAMAQSQLQAIHRDELVRAGLVLDELSREMTPLLTPVQLEELNKERRERERMWDRLRYHPGAAREEGSPHDFGPGPGEPPSPAGPTDNGTPPALVQPKP